MFNKPDFQAMSTPELKAYVLEHREDNEAFYALSNRIKEQGKPFKIEELPEILQSKRQQRQTKE